MVSETPESRSPLISGTAISLLLLSTISVSIRFYGKGVLRKIIRADDWIILAALLFSIAVTAMPLIALNYDLGLRLVDSDPDNLVHILQLVYANDLLYPTAVGLTKVSISWSYLHLFPSHSNRIFCYTTTGFVVIYSALCLVLLLAECRPIWAHWDHTIKGAQCWDTNITIFINASLNSAIDVVVYLWPIRPLWALQLPAQQRLGLVVLFSMGLVVCVVGIMRIYYLSQVFVGGDILWNGTPIWICSILEVNLGIICACLTGIKPVIVKLFPGVFSSSQRSQENRHSYVQYGQHTERMTAGGPESFAFEQLSSIKLKHSQPQQQQQNHPGGEGNSSNAAFGKGSANDLGVHASGKMYVENPILKSNNVWVTITNHKGAEHHLPANAISVSHEFTVNNEAPNGGSMTSRSANNEPSDADSEEWIFNGAANVESARTK